MWPGSEKLRLATQMCGRAGPSEKSHSHSWTSRIVIAAPCLGLTLPLSFSWSGIRRVSQFVCFPLHSDVNDVTMANIFEKLATTCMNVSIFSRGSILKPVDETVLCSLLLGLPYFLA